MWIVLAQDNFENSSDFLLDFLTSKKADNYLPNTKDSWPKIQYIAARIYFAYKISHGKISNNLKS